MTRDEIYNHLAQVYLGKQNEIKKSNKRQSDAWLVINIVITVVIFASSFYGLTAFLAHRADALQNRVIYALNNGPIRIRYDLAYPYPPVKTFSLSVPAVNVDKYSRLRFSIRALDDGTPGRIRVQVKNQRNEIASVFVDHVGSKWQKVAIPLSAFKNITDWSSVNAVSFIFESWNARQKKGTVLIDDVCFSS